MDQSGNMSSDSPESEEHAVSELLYSAVLLVCAQMMACDTEWRAVDRNLADDVVSDCAIFTVAMCVQCCILHCFFSNLVGVLASVVLRGTAEYVLMEFIVLLLTISPNTGSYSESEEYISAYPLEVGIVAAWFVRRIRFFSGGAGGTLESSGRLWIEGEWTHLADTIDENCPFSITTK